MAETMQNQPKKKEMTQILEVIPQICGDWRKQSPEMIAKATEYLQNPCVVEMRFRYADGRISDYRMRVALCLRTDFENIPNMGIMFKGAEFDVTGYYTLNELLQGWSNGKNGDADEVLTYLGRMNELEEPAKRQDIFEWDMNWISGQKGSES